MKTIAVLLTVYNRKEKTLDCLTALFSCFLPKEYNYEAFLVDDRCTDGTVGAVKEKFPQVNIIQGTGNLFWNRGMYLAWKTAAKAKDYDYYLWLNDDTTLYSHSIQELLECSEVENNQRIVCGTTCASNDKQKVTYGGRNLKGAPIVPNGKIQLCNYFNGNIVLIPKYVYERVGMNDPLFRHALGDFDYGLRAKKMGIEAIVSLSIVGICNKHEQLPAWCNPKISVIGRLKQLYKPLGSNPIEFFRYKCRHKGLLIACLFFCSNHFHALMPWFRKTRI